MTNHNWRYLGILCSKFEDGQWTTFDSVEFTRDGREDGEQFLFEKSLYFVSFRNNETRQTDIYRAHKVGGRWTKTERIAEPINSLANEWHPSLTAMGDLYFASERSNRKFQADIYKSEFINGAFADPIKLTDSINSPYNDGDPLISPDERFLIFHSERPGGFGGHDLYISHRRSNGTWSKAKNMGPSINSEKLEFGPSLSSDGKYLLFTRRESFQTNIPSRIYWVKLSVQDYKID